MAMIEALSSIPEKDITPGKTTEQLTSGADIVVFKRPRMRTYSPADTDPLGSAQRRFSAIHPSIAPPSTDTSFADIKPLEL